MTEKILVQQHTRGEEDRLLRWWEDRFNLLTSRLNSPDLLKGAYYNQKPIEAMKRHMDDARSIDFILSIKRPLVGRSVFDQWIRRKK